MIFARETSSRRVTRRTAQATAWTGGGRRRRPNRGTRIARSSAHTSADRGTRALVAALCSAKFAS